MLNGVQGDYDLEIGDMTKDQMVDYADAFRNISNYARRWERDMRREAAASFY